MTRWMLAVVVGAALWLTLAPSASTHVSVRTAIRRYEPFAGGRIAPGVKVERTVSGSCAAPSSEDRRSDAYRCIVGNVLGDPCFADKAVNYVLCPSRPQARVLRINLTQLLPHNSLPARATGYPWTVQTSEGAWCVRYVGPRYPVLQFTISYLCLSPYGYLLNEPRRGTTWTAIYAPGLKVVNRPPGSYRRVDLASVWS
jgi:hypothetical protein